MDLTVIHQLLNKNFNEEELKTLCLGLKVDYDNLPASGKENKARELVTYMDRTGRLAELQETVFNARPHLTGAGQPPATAHTPLPTTRWQLQPDDSDHLVRLLAALPDFRLDRTRLDFLDDVFAGSPRKQDILGLLDVSGTSRGAAVRLITRLTQFGQDEPGQETLGVLINKLHTYIGGGTDADFLRDLFGRYPLKGTPTASRGITDWRATERPTEVQEKIIGENTLRDIRMLELGLEASRAVVRIVTTESLGSGFLVGPGLIMTNHHVISSQPEAQPCAFQFNYQLDKNLQPATLRVGRTKPDGLFYTNPNLDVTVVEILDAPTDVTPVTLARQKVQKDNRVNIIQHPGGHYKKVSMQNNFVAFADARIIQYLTSTEPGSSGSPVFNNDFVVVGIHHSGGMLLEPGSHQTYLRNAGSSMIAVLDALRDTAPEIYARLKVQ